MQWNEEAVSPLWKMNLLCGSASLLSLHIKTEALVHSPRKEKLLLSQLNLKSISPIKTNKTLFGV